MSTSRSRAAAMTACLTSFAFAGGVAPAAPAVEAAVAEPAALRLPSMRAAPAVDGVIGDSEWAQATRIVGFMTWGQDTFCQRAVIAWLGWDERALYIALESELPPSGVLEASTTPETPFSVKKGRDDHIEVWLAPDPEAVPAASPVVQFLGNSVGAFMQILYYPSGERKEGAFPGWQFANRTADGVWQAEISVTFAALGVKTIADGSEWRVRLVRAWRNPRENSTWGHCKGAFAKVESMARVVLDRNAPLVRMERLGAIYDGAVDTLVSVRANADARLEAHVCVQPLYDLAERTQTASLVLKQGQTGEVSLAVPKGRLKADGKHYALIDVRNHDSSQPVFRHAFGWHGRAAQRWSGAALAATEQGIAGDVLLYASFDVNADADRANGGGTHATATAQKLELVPGRTGKALRLGKGTSCRFPAVDNIRIEDGTVEFWMRPVDWDHTWTGIYNFFAIEETASRSFRGHALRCYGAERKRPLRYAYLAVVDDDVLLTGNGQVLWESGRWYHCALTWADGCDVVLYLDGRAVASCRLKRKLTAANLGQWLELGSSSVPPRTTDFDELYVYRRRLAPEEIKWACSSHDPATHARMSTNAIRRHTLFPYLNRLDVHVDEIFLDAAAPTAVRAALRRADSDTKPIAALSVAGLTPANRVIRFENLPPLATGDYVITVDIGGKVHRRPFHRTVWEFEHNTIGLTTEVMPPFTPLQVDGNRLDCVLRTYALGGPGLIEQVTCKGEPLLAAPVRYELHAGGKVVPLRYELRVTSAQAHEVKGLLASGGGGVDFKSSFTLEVDGMMKVDLELSPQGGPVTVEALNLLVPLRNAAPLLCHILTDKARGNRSGKLPTGDGIVWRSGEESKTDLLGTFVPYVWLGSIERGLCWFADNDRGWVTDDGIDALDITRAGEQIILRVRLAAKPFLLDGLRRITFGLMATPAKPRPEGWRTVDFSPTAKLREQTDILTAYLIPGPFGTGRISYDWAPEGHDFSLIEKLEEARASGQVDKPFIDTVWAQKYLPYANIWQANKSRGWKSGKGWLVKIHAHAANLARTRPDFLAVYSHMRALANNCLPLRDFHGEWMTQDTAFKPFDPEHDLELKQYGIAHSPSCVDYYVWSNARMMEHGAGCIYFDVAKLRGSFNRTMSAAYVREDGRIQPDVGIFAMREAIKRSAVYAHQTGKAGPWIHITNCYPVPVFSFGWTTFDFEWRYGTSPYQERFTDDFILAEASGIHTGTIPLALHTGVPLNVRKRDPDLYRRVVRSQFATLTPYEIKLWSGGEVLVDAKAAMYRFGYGDADCRVYRWWDADKPVQIHGPEHKALVLVKPRKVLVVIGDFGGGGAYRLDVDAKRLIINAQCSARDGETGTALDMRSAGRIECEIPKHDFRIVVVE